jgi:hypothetical protein
VVEWTYFEIVKATFKNKSLRFQLFKKVYILACPPLERECENVTDDTHLHKNTRTPNQNSQFFLNPCFFAGFYVIIKDKTKKEL